MNRDIALKLQALVDGELSPADAREAAELARTDPSAQALVAELRSTRGWLAAHTPEAAVPESRDFYWSKIRRQIEREAAAESAARSVGQSPLWLRWLTPAAAVGAVIIVITLALRFPSSRPFVALADGHEEETPLEDTSSITFRSESAAMTVVWVNTHGN